jgi:outer membrane protein assembly factor BamB
MSGAYRPIRWSGWLAVTLAAALLLAACDATSTPSVTDDTDPSGAVDVDHELMAEEPADGGTIRPYEWHLVGVSPDEGTLLVTAFFGGVASDCNRFEGWEVDEGDEQVVVAARMWQNDAAEACTDEGVTETLPLHLDEPLGDRDLVGCGQDDCRTRPLPHHLDLGGVVQAHKGAIAVGAVLMRGSVGPDGEVRWLQQAGHAGRGLAGPGVVLDTDGAEEIAARDPVSGDTRWSLAGTPLGIAGDALIACHSDAGDDPGRPDVAVAAHDLADGAERWRVEEAGCARALATDGEVVAFTDHGDRDAPRLLLLDLADGNVRAEIALDIGGGGMVGDPVVVGDEVVLAGPELGIIAADLHDGSLREVAGEVDGGGLDAAGRSLGGADGVLLLGTTSGVAAVDVVGDGRVRWEMATEQDPPVLASGDAIFAASPADGELARLDPDSGGERWRAEVGRSGTIDVAVHDGVAYAVTSTALVAVDLDDGEQRWWVPLVER